MGVHGLWNLIKDAGRPLDPKDLEGKVMAVDISIWLNMAVKGARDYHGHSALSMHLISLFHRICKLLHMGVKPIFVFDGKAPELKRKTVQERKQMRSLHKMESEHANKKLLQNILKKQALEHVESEINDDKKEKSSRKRKLKQDNKKINLAGKQQEDIYNLPPMSKSLEDAQDDEFENFLAEDNYYDISELNSIKYEDEEFSKLSDEMQYELLRDIKEVKKRRRTKIEAMPVESSSFSMYQISGILDKNKITKKMETVEKRMSKRQIQDVDSTALLDLYESTKSEDSARVEKVFLNHKEEKMSVLIHTDHKQTTKSNDKELIVEDISKQAENDVKLKRDKKVIDSKKISLRMKNQLQPQSGAEDLKVLLSDEESSDEDVIPVGKAKEDADSLKVKDESMKEYEKQSAPVNDGNNIGVSELKLPVSKFAKTGATSVVMIEEETKETNKSVTEAITISSSSDSEEEFMEVKEQELPNQNAPNELPTNKNKEVQILANRSSEQNIVLLPNESDENENIEIKSEEGETEDKRILEMKTKAQEEEVSKLDITSDDGEVEDKPSTSMEDKNVDEDELQSSTEALENPWQNQNLEDIESIRASLMLEEKDLENIAHAKQRAAREVTNSAQTECKELLSLFGIPFLMSPEEAEAQCAALENFGLISGIVTDDSDVWLFGGKFVVKDMFNGKRNPTVFDIKDIEDHLKLNRSKMICIAMCSGSDYTTGIPGVGPKTSVEIINEFGGENFECLKKFSEWRKNKDKQELSNKKITKLKKIELDSKFPSEVIFNAYMNPVVDDGLEEFEWGIPDLEGLRDFAVKSMGWSRQKLNEVLLPVMKQFTRHQSRQESFNKLFHPVPKPTKKITKKPQNKKNSGKNSRNIKSSLKSAVVNDNVNVNLSEESSDSE